MLRALEASGRRNYSLFLRDDGLLIGYFETDDLEISTAYLADSAAATTWEEWMTEFFVDLEGRPDQGFTEIPELFHLEDQLAALEV
jgi:L-rhamnose mutarotase